MGREMGIDVTAEGVEDVRTLDVLPSVGCDSYQGHLFSEALSESEFIYRHRFIWNRSPTADHLGLSDCAFAATTICQCRSRTHFSRACPIGLPTQLC